MSRAAVRNERGTNEMFLPCFRESSIVLYVVPYSSVAPDELELYASAQLSKIFLFVKIHTW